MSEPEPYYAKNQKPDERRRDGSFNVRSSHNKAKVILLYNDGRRKRLLDLGSGRGGDTSKWRDLHYHEVFAVDVDTAGLRELQARHTAHQHQRSWEIRRSEREGCDSERSHPSHRKRHCSDLPTYRSRSPPPLQVTTLCADMSEALGEFVPEGHFDIAAAMFSLHFVCEPQDVQQSSTTPSEPPAGLRRTIHNVASALRPQGVFVGVTLDITMLTDEVMTFHTHENQQFARFRVFPGKKQVEVLIHSISDQPRWEWFLDFEQLETCLHDSGMRLANDEEAKRFGLSTSTGPLTDIAPLKRLSNDERRFTQMYRYWVAVKH